MKLSRVINHKLATHHILKMTQQHAKPNVINELMNAVCSIAHSERDKLMNLIKGKKTIQMVNSSIFRILEFLKTIQQYCNPHLSPWQNVIPTFPVCMYKSFTCCENLYYKPFASEP
jgi:hypothetical protein